MALISASKSRGLFDETEKPQQLFPIETQAIIRDRYDFAVSLAQNRRVLEVGCGAGLGLRYLAASAQDLKCLEYSQENVDSLANRFSDFAELYKGDAHDMPFAADQFDLIVALAMIYYLSLEAFLKEANRVLAQDGVLLFCTSNKDVPGFVPAPFTTQYYSIPELTASLIAEGFAPSFFGAFPTGDGSLFKRRVKSFLKTAVKGTVCIFPGGKALWRRMRESTLKDVGPLPDDAQDMLQYSSEREPLPGDKINTNYRVIYVVARKICA